MTPIRSGLLVLQGNRLELLRETVFDWIGSHPLGPLEEELFLVQSNGVAEWLKMALAESHGICAATRIELPARFLWRSYRQVLGASAVPTRATMDKTALTWRILQLLPAQLARAEFAPLSRFLSPGDWTRRLQLAERLADLFDQYQVYRADWLAGWAAGIDGLPGARGQQPLPEEQRWQPLLWRELVASLGPEALQSSRPELHSRILQTLSSGAAPAAPVPRRVIVFGLSSVPQQTLEALDALSSRCQVILAIPNPCRFHWADIMDGRELLRAPRKRHPHRAGLDLAALPLEDMHAHANPLLAGWGRQGRDIVRQLDAYENTSSADHAVPRIDLFDDGEGNTLLTQVQACVRDLVPLGEPVTAPRISPDRSMAFHIAHSAQREVEILHDQLLELLADPPGAAIAPRDIVVMVPDVETFAPAVRAVFGQYSRFDARHIPYSLADLQQRSANPILVALEWLLRLPHQRAGLSELESLLDVPAVAARFGIEADDLPLLGHWMQGAGIRWGVHADQRAELGLNACGEQNSWLFGLQRMLLGFASGPTDDFGGIEPFGEIGGLDARLVGSLASLVAAVMRWNELAQTLARPSVWAERLTELLAGFFQATDDAERETFSGLQDASRHWLEAAAAAGFEDEIPLSVVREAWLAGVDEPSLAQRFLGGGVTFCTLLPMRAVPFEVVCLLGMNDGDYPRATQRSDFDLMALPGQRRPGDRSRRDDDRYLMLEAVLSARQVLYVSWTGRSVRDNSVQPPSVLVAQLRDYLAAGWGRELVDSLTTEHPLQPFSRRYFEAGSDLRTYAREWREAHADADGSAPAPLQTGQADERMDFEGTNLTIAHLSRFLKNPVKAFFRLRLEVQFDELPKVIADEERFEFDGLETWNLIDCLARHPASDELEGLRGGLEEQASRLLRAGQMPMGALGARESEALLDATAPMLRAWHAWQAALPKALGAIPLQIESERNPFKDWLVGLRSTGLAGAHTILTLTASELLEQKGALKQHQFVDAWVRALAAAVCGETAATVLVGRDAVVSLPALTGEDAVPAWQALLDAWQEGMALPLSLTSKTALAYLRDRDDPKGRNTAAELYQGSSDKVRGEVEEPCLARTYPDFASLTLDGRFAHWAPLLFEPMVAWLATASTTAHDADVDAADVSGPVADASAESTA